MLLNKGNFPSIDLLCQHRNGVDISNGGESYSETQQHGAPVAGSRPPLPYGSVRSTSVATLHRHPMGSPPPPTHPGGSVSLAGELPHHPYPGEPPQHHARVPIEPDAILATELLPYLPRAGPAWYTAPPHVGAPSWVQAQSAAHSPPIKVSIIPEDTSVSGLASSIGSTVNASVPSKHDNNGNGGGGSGDGGSGDGGTSGGGTSVPSGVPTLTSASESSSGTVHPPCYMSTEEERTAIKALSKEMPVFHGGSKAPSEWPSFWSRISSILRFSTYTPGGPLVTTPENANNSHRLYLLLTLKLGSPPDLPFLDNPKE